MGQEYGPMSPDDLRVIKRVGGWGRNYLLTVKSIDLVVAHTGFLCIKEEIICIFYSGKLD